MFEWQWPTSRTASSWLNPCSVLTLSVPPLSLPGLVATHGAALLYRWTMLPRQHLVCHMCWIKRCFWDVIIEGSLESEYFLQWEICSNILHRLHEILRIRVAMFGLENVENQDVVRSVHRHGHDLVQWLMRDRVMRSGQCQVQVRLLLSLVTHGLVTGYSFKLLQCNALKTNSWK